MTTPVRRSRRCAVILAAMLGAATITFAACGSDSAHTCQDFAAMAPDTGLLVQFTSEQTSALKASLRSTGYDDGAHNQTIGRTEVLSYCNIYDGVANSNQDQPISNAH